MTEEPRALLDSIWQFLVEYGFTVKAPPHLLINNYENGRMGGTILIHPGADEYLREPEFIVLHECLHYVCSGDTPEDSGDAAARFSDNLLKLIDHGGRVGFLVPEAQYVTFRVQVLEDVEKNSSSRELQDKLMRVLFSWYVESRQGQTLELKFHAATFPKG